MKKYINAIIFLLFPIYSLSVEFSYVGACSDQPSFYTSVEYQKFPISLGQLSLEIFENNNIEYKGGAGGFSSIMGSPSGDNAIEVVSDTVMRAHGLCFSINGFAPDEMPDKIMVNSNSDKIVWWVGYATYHKGLWSDYCLPTYLISPVQFCQNNISWVLKLNEKRFF